MKKILLFIIFLSCIIINLSAEQNKLKTVTLQLKWTHQFQFAGYYAAIEKGYYKNAGIEVKLLEAVPEKDPVNEVITKNLDFGISSSDLIINKSHGARVVILAPIFQHSPFIFLTKKSSHIQTVQDLNGKKIMIEPQAAELLAYLNKEGINYIRVIEHSFNINDLVNDKVDAISAYTTTEPFFLENYGISYNIFSPLVTGIDFYGDCLYTTEKFMKSDPETVKKFREASIKGWEYALNNKNEIINIIINKYNKKLSKEFLTFEANKTHELIMPEVIDIGTTSLKRWQKIAVIYKERNLINKIPDFTTFIYNPNPMIDLSNFYLLLFILSAIIIFLFILLIPIRKLNIKLKKEIKERKDFETELENTKAILQSAFNQTPIPMILSLAPDGIIKFMNQAAKSFLEISDEIEEDKTSILTYKPSWINYDETGKLLPAEKLPIRQAFNGKAIHNKVMKIITKNNNTKWEIVSSCPIYNSNGDKIAVFSVFPDITERKLMEEKISLSEKNFMTIFNTSPFPISVTRKSDSTLFLANDAALIFYELSKDDLNKFHALELFIDKSERDKIIEILNMNGIINSYEMKLKTYKSNKIKWILFSAAIIYYNNEECILASQIDITPRKEAEDKIIKSHNLLETVLNNMAQAMIVTNNEIEVIAYNNKYMQLFNYENNDIYEKIAMKELISLWGKRFSIDSNHLNKTLENLKSKIPFTSEFYQIDNYNNKIWIQVFHNPLPGGGFVRTYTDITERKLVEEELNKYASVDMMTGVLNRRMALSLLEKQIHLSKRGKTSLSICFIDANELKSINDRYGHLEGDTYLKSIVKIISNSIRAADSLCRIGGDEFLIIMPDCNFENANIVWTRIKEKIDEVNSKKLKPYSLSISHGICEYPQNTDISIDDFINTADNEMYKEKRIIKSQMNGQNDYS